MCLYLSCASRALRSLILMQQVHSLTFQERATMSSGPLGTFYTVVLVKRYCPPLAVKSDLTC